jgi:hypothetical protein
MYVFQRQVGAAGTRLRHGGRLAGLRRLFRPKWLLTPFSFPIFPSNALLPKDAGLRRILFLVVA